MGKSHTSDVGTATYVHTFVINAVMVQGRLRARPLSHGQCISAKYNVFLFFLPAHINLCRSSFRYFSDTLCTIIFNQASQSRRVISRTKNEFFACACFAVPSSRSINGINYGALECSTESSIFFSNLRSFPKSYQSSKIDAKIYNTIIGFTVIEFLAKLIYLLKVYKKFAKY